MSIEDILSPMNVDVIITSTIHIVTKIITDWTKRMEPQALLISLSGWMGIWKREASILF